MTEAEAVAHAANAEYAALHAEIDALQAELVRLVRVADLSRQLVDAYADNTLAGTERLGRAYMALVVALGDTDAR